MIIVQPYICEMGKRADNIHMKRYCNVHVYVYVYLWASVYIGLCLCVHICIVIAGMFYHMYMRDRSVPFFQGIITNAKYCHHTVPKNTIGNRDSRCNFNYQEGSTKL